MKSEDPVNLKNILKIPRFIIEGIKFHAAGKLYSPKPTFSTIRVTHRCNSRCPSCIFWKENNKCDELSPQSIEALFKDKLFSSLEMLTLSGGEATLREDLADIAEGVLKSCRNIRGITLCTNGFDNRRVIHAVKNLLKLAQGRGNIKLYVSVSLDGIGHLHGKIRGVPDAFEKVTKTLTDLKEIQQNDNLFLSVNCVVQPLNVLHLKEIAAYGEENNLPLTFSPICVSDVFTNDEDVKKHLQFSPKQLAELQKIIKNELMPRLRTFDRAYWQDYFNLSMGAKRRLPCLLLHHYLQIDARGVMRGCDFDSRFIYGHIKESEPHQIWFSKKSRNMRRTIKNNDCHQCALHCNVGYSLAKEFFYYARYLLLEKFHHLSRKNIFR
ncbi:MAG: radical SAM protein [Smithella sp.]